MMTEKVAVCLDFGRCSAPEINIVLLYSNRILTALWAY